MVSSRVSSPNVPTAQHLPQMLAQLEPAVQAVLYRYDRSRVARPDEGSVVRQADRGRVDFEWVALLSTLHRADAASGAMDYVTVLERLITPAIQLAAQEPEGRTPRTSRTWTC
jgi:hypothetical protein